MFNDEPVAVRIVIDLAQPVQYAAVKQEDARKVALNIRSQSYQVVLDAGHGGKDPGAIAYSGRYEKDFTLPLTLKIYDLLLAEPFIQPVLTRADDTFVELDQRAQLANDLEADLFISIHGNTYIPSVHGTRRPITMIPPASGSPISSIAMSSMPAASATAMCESRNTRYCDWRRCRPCWWKSAIYRTRTKKP